MATVYTQNLGERGSILRQRVKAFDEVADILSCHDELVLQQSVMQDHVEEYSEALDTNDKGKKVAWGSLVNERAKDVISTKATMARIDQMRSQNISRETLFVWVKSISERLYEVFPDMPEQVNLLVEEIESSILGTSSANVKESDLFMEMNQTVPAIEVDFSDGAEGEM
jgi:hypothetical protein